MPLFHEATAEKLPYSRHLNERLPLHYQKHPNQLFYSVVQKMLCSRPGELQNTRAMAESTDNTVQTVNTRRFYLLEMYRLCCRCGAQTRCKCIRYITNALLHGPSLSSKHCVSIYTYCCHHNSPLFSFFSQPLTRGLMIAFRPKIYPVKKGVCSAIVTCSGVRLWVFVKCLETILVVTDNSINHYIDLN